MHLSDLYKSILQSLDVTSDSQGLLSFNYAGKSMPAVVSLGPDNERRLALPTHERLRTGDWNGLVAFHPLSENLLRGESPVLRKLKGIIHFRLTSIFVDLLQQFVALAADPDRHAGLSPKAQILLSAMPDADTKTVAAVRKIIEASTLEGANKFFSIYLKRGANFKGQKVSRAAIVNMPIMDEFDREDGHVFGVQLRKKDFAGLQRMIEYILPDCDDAEEYSAGSTSMVAPYFEALIQAYVNVAKRFNQIIKVHTKQLENVDELITDLSWHDEDADLSKYRDVIPPLAGNDGDQEGQPEPVAPRPIPPVFASGGSAKPVSNLTSAAPAKPAAFTGQAAVPGAGPAAGGFNSDFRLEQPAPQPIVNTGRGLDFNSVMSAASRNMHPARPVPGQPMPGYGAPGMPVAMAPMQGYPAYAPPGVVMVDAYGRPVQAPPTMGMGYGAPISRTTGQPLHQGFTRGGQPPPGYGGPGYGVPMQPMPDWMGGGGQVSYGIQNPSAPFAGNPGPAYGAGSSV